MRKRKSKDKKKNKQNDNKEGENKLSPSPRGHHKPWVLRTKLSAQSWPYRGVFVIPS